MKVDIEGERYETVRTKAEIDDLLERCGEAEFTGTTAFPRMSYEQGVLYGISWLIEAEDEANPLDD